MERDIALKGPRAFKKQAQFGLNQLIGLADFCMRKHEKEKIWKILDLSVLGCSCLLNMCYPGLFYKFLVKGIIAVPTYMPFREHLHPMRLTIPWAHTYILAWVTPVVNRFPKLTFIKMIMCQIQAGLSIHLHLKVLGQCWPWPMPTNNQAGVP